MATSRHSRTALGLPGRLTIRQPERTPAAERLSMERGVFASVSARMASAIPGTSMSSTARVASGVTSLGPRPVPPVVRMRSTSSESGPLDQPFRDQITLVRQDVAQFQGKPAARHDLGDGVAAGVLALAFGTGVAHGQDREWEIVYHDSVGKSFKLVRKCLAPYIKSWETRLSQSVPAHRGRVHSNTRPEGPTNGWPAAEGETVCRASVWQVGQQKWMRTIRRYCSVRSSPRSGPGRAAGSSTVRWEGPDTPWLYSKEGPRFLGIDLDPDVLKVAERRSERHRKQLRLVAGSFADLESIAAENGFSPVDGVLMDLGALLTPGGYGGQRVQHK